MDEEKQPDNKGYKLLQNTIEVEHNGNTYAFGIPSFRDEMALGMREREIRRAINPQDPSPQGLDLDTFTMIQAAAVFELMLKQGPRWCFSEGEEKVPVIDHTKWSAEHVEEVTAVWLKYTTAVSDFRSGRTANGRSAVGQAVAGQQDSGDVPVRPGAPGP